MTNKKTNQSIFRRTLFWTHLAVGIAVGIVIFMLALTGVLLTYEAQIKSAFEPKISATVDNAEMLSTDELVAIAQPVFEGQTATLDYYSDPEKPMTVKAGRHDLKLIDPYTGAFIEAETNPSEEFFGFVEALHRSFAGERGGLGATIVKASNLAFLFLILSGIYLWLPRRWKWSFLKQKILFAKMPTSKARDFNWHHVFSFWILIPLLAVVGTGVIISYEWVNQATFGAFGLEAPQGKGRGKGMWAKGSEGGTSELPVDQLVSYQSIFEKARAIEDNWTTLSIIIPSNPKAKNVDVMIDQGNGKQFNLQQQVTFSRETGEMVKQQSSDELATPTQALRRYIRFLHSGEVYGFWGQTLAGLASLGSLFLVWTGLALAWRRLISPLFAPKAKPVAG